MDNELETRAASKKSDGSLGASEAADDNRRGQSIDEIASAGGDAQGRRRAERDHIQRGHQRMR